MSESSVVHSTFTIERTYPAPAAKVFAALSNPKKKKRWFAEGEGWTVLEFTMDFRVGGVESSRFRFNDGPEVRNDTVYQDIVPEQRVIFAYSMSIGGKRISSSLATIELVPSGNSTRFVYTEQGAFLDGADNVKNREEGSRELLENLARALAEDAEG